MIGLATGLSLFCVIVAVTVCVIFSMRRKIQNKNISMPEPLNSMLYTVLSTIFSKILQGCLLIGAIYMDVYIYMYSVTEHGTCALYYEDAFTPLCIAYTCA